MGRRLSLLVGITLILIGGLSLAFTLVMPRLGMRAWAWGAWRLWPLVVVAAGLLFVVSPLLVRGRRGLGGLFIPGVPILTTGGILLYASVLDAWHAWEWLWPLEILAVAAGFLLAAVYMRAIWLLFPAIVVGANGALLQFCAVTDLWESWAMLWAIEPLSIGLAFLLINVKQRARGLFIAGLILCVVAAAGLIGMTAVFPGWLLVNALGPAILVLAGVLMLVHSLVRRPASPGPVPE
ncbi:MAG TPA: hypothetical protein VMY40_13265 [Anaerolineae bacterium]|nr:hypothetical protein [Anaerolineae bacterium]